MTIRELITTAASLPLLILAAACTDPAAPSDEGEDAPSLAGLVSAYAGYGAASLEQDIATLRQATSRFHRFDEAVEAGYTVTVAHPVTGATCLADPDLGGMGQHMLNPDLVDGAVSVASPEAVIYEPMQNGRLRLVGVEYIVPYAIRGPDEAPPTLFGREFLHNPTFGLWMLHAYVWKHNPEGMFATWNPAITCEHAGA